MLPNSIVSLKYSDFNDLIDFNDYSYYLSFMK